MAKEQLYWPSEILVPISENLTKKVISVKIDRHRLDTAYIQFNEFIDNMIHEGKLKKWVIMNMSIYKEEERLPVIMFDLVRNEPENIEKYVKEVLLKQDLRIAHSFYFDAMNIANELNNLHGGQTENIEKLETLFHNTYKK